MIIEIETVYGDRFLSGRSVSLPELNDRMKNVLNDIDEKGFIQLFCSRYGYDVIKIPENDTADFVIDPDVHRIYVPR